MIGVSPLLVCSMCVLNSCLSRGWRHVIDCLHFILSGIHPTAVCQAGIYSRLGDSPFDTFQMVGQRKFCG